MKQETLEEAAERYVEQITTIEFGKPYNAPHREKSFIEGAKWQQERMYSEEEVLELLHSRMLYTLGNDYEEISTIKWFQQFKQD